MTNGIIHAKYTQSRKKRTNQADTDEDAFIVTNTDTNVH
jgi:hypothetical protein